MDETIDLPRTLEDISVSIGINYEELINTASSIRLNVTTKRITKKGGGIRTLFIPSEKLKNILQKINRNILQRIDLPVQAHGSIPGKSPITNAKEHVGKSYILKLDIKDFYPSIRYSRIKDLFLKLGFSKKSATIMTRLTSFNGRLGQGFPTSSSIANLILAQNVIPRIAGLCNTKHLTFTIYQDDITISGGGSVKSLISTLKNILNQHGFIINTKKIKISNSQSQQKVTGYVVNKKVNIPKGEFRLLRALVHNCLIYGIEKVADRPIESFIRHIKGRIQRVKDINPIRGNKLENEFTTSLHKLVQFNISN